MTTNRDNRFFIRPQSRAVELMAAAVVTVRAFLAAETSFGKTKKRRKQIVSNKILKVNELSKQRLFVWQLIFVCVQLCVFRKALPAHSHSLFLSLALPDGCAVILLLCCYIYGYCCYFFLLFVD